MASSDFKSQFENELRQKLQQKANSRTSQQAVLLRAFRYFDLDNSQCVSLNEFVKAIEKIGVIIQDPHKIQKVFQSYDLDSSGSLDYKQFTSVIFQHKNTSSIQTPQRTSRYSIVQSGEATLQKLRSRLAARGGRGIIGLGRQFQIMDDDGSKRLEIPEFVKAMRDYRVDLNDNQIQTLFRYLDKDGSGGVDYNQFLRAVRGPMNRFREALVLQAFEKMDRDRSGVLDINDIKGIYNARGHPDVRSGKKSQDEVLGEFLQTFEMNHSLSGSRDRIVTKEEFIQYYNNISCSIDNDQYFEMMMNNTWKLSEAPACTRNKAWSNKPEQTKARAEEPSSRTVQLLFSKFRTRLMSRGARGIIGIQRQFKIMDDDNSKNLSLYEFQKGCKDFRLELSDSDLEQIFRAIDRDRSGVIDYDELLRGIRGEMNQFRKRLVTQAWNKIDSDHSGVLDINDIRGVYSASQHPDVRAGKKTEDDILGEFLQTFETHHNISDLSRRDQKVTKQEFQQYYNNISSGIDDDQYFQLMITNAWKLKGQPTKKPAWAGQYGSREFTRTGVPIQEAPFGTTGHQHNWATSNRPGPVRQAPISRPAGQSSRTRENQSAQELLQNLKAKLAARGARGFIGMSRQFKIMDDDNSKCLDINEFGKAMRDFRVNLSLQQTRLLFDFMDADRSGFIQYQEFVHRLRGEMNQNRKSLVQRAFRKLDKNQNGIVEIDDVRGVYNAKNHPDVRTGKKTEEEVLCDFLDTFESHHATYKQDSRDHRISFEEFLEYYNHVSASIDDDRYFELMMNNAWNFENRSYQKGWGGEV